MKKKSNKIVLLGDSGVGKTCLVVRLVKEIFQDSDSPTIGASFFKKTVKRSNGELMDIEIWDTAGQEKYDRGARGAILVFDVTRKNSYERVKKKWERKVRSTTQGGGSCFMILIGNKTDLSDQRVLTKLDGEDLKKELGAISYIETSCLNGDNIGKVMNTLVTHIEHLDSIAEGRGKGHSGTGNTTIRKDDAVDFGQIVSARDGFVL